jgi:hypothetical protein
MIVHDTEDRVGNGFVEAVVMGMNGSIDVSSLKQDISSKLNINNITYKDRAEVCNYIINKYKISVIIISKYKNKIKITPKTSIITSPKWTKYMFLYCDYEPGKDEQYKLIEFNETSLFKVDSGEDPPDFIILFVYLWTTMNSDKAYSTEDLSNVLFNDKFKDIYAATGTIKNIESMFYVPPPTQQFRNSFLFRRKDRSLKKKWVLNINVNVELYPGDQIPISKRPVLSCNKKLDDIARLWHSISGKEPKYYNRFTINPPRGSNSSGYSKSKIYYDSSSRKSSSYGSSSITRNQRLNNQLFNGGKKTRKPNKLKRHNKTKNLRQRKVAR